MKKRKTPSARITLSVIRPAVCFGFMSSIPRALWANFVVSPKSLIFVSPPRTSMHRTDHMIRPGVTSSVLVGGLDAGAMTS